MGEAPRREVAAVESTLGKVAVSAAEQSIRAGQVVAEYSQRELRSLDGVTEKIAEWMGEVKPPIYNEAGDVVFMSTNGTKRLRFDIKKSYPHEHPLAHVDELINGAWVKYGQVYPGGIRKNANLRRKQGLGSE